MAVVSSGLGDAVRESLKAVGLEEMFDVVLTLEDVTAAKPSPEGYLRAMELLGADPARCVAYEDSSTGIASARGAGIAAIVDVRWHDA
jgi:HAD superfamily hydrolase (TIGR01509 family)